VRWPYAFFLPSNAPTLAPVRVVVNLLYSLCMGFTALYWVRWHTHWCLLSLDLIKLGYVANLCIWTSLLLTMCKISV